MISKAMGRDRLRGRRIVKNYLKYRMPKNLSSTNSTIIKTQKVYWCVYDPAESSSHSYVPFTEDTF
jgi:hypothetical protein